MYKLYLMIGLPGSGKSTFARKQAKRMNAIVISRDEIRFSKMIQTDDYFAKEKEVFHEYIDKISDALVNSGKDVFADATQLSVRSREKLIRQVRNKIKIPFEFNAVEMETPYTLCVKRNEEREGAEKVPATVINNMTKQYNSPTFAEGFSHIYHVKSNGNIIAEELIPYIY